MALPLKYAADHGSDITKVIGEYRCAQGHICEYHTDVCVSNEEIGGAVEQNSLADPGGPGGPGPPLTPRFGGPSYTVWRPHCKFKSKIINFGALFFIFSKNFPASLRSASTLYIFHILLVSLCSLFHLLKCILLYYIMCILLYYIMCILLHYNDSSHNLSCL